MRTKLVVPSLVLLAGMLAPGAVYAEEYRGTWEQQMACTPDVWRLCGDQIPDVNRIVACLQRNTPNLSGSCRAVFESSNSLPQSQGVAPPRARAVPAPNGRMARRRRVLATMMMNEAHGLTSQTSTHSANVSCARRSGAMRTALWVEPAAGTTMSNAFIETSQ